MRALMDLVEGLSSSSSLLNTLVDMLEKEHSVKLAASYNQTRNIISLSKIIVDSDHRGSGVGSKVMTELCVLADQMKATIVLTPSSDFGGSVPKLISFYSKFGFVQNKGKNKDYEISDTMYRLPK